jgi:hypothetical protein
MFGNITAKQSAIICYPLMMLVALLGLLDHIPSRLHLFIVFSCTVFHAVSMSTGNIMLTSFGDSSTTPQKEGSEQSESKGISICWFLAASISFLLLTVLLIKLGWGRHFFVTIGLPMALTTILAGSIHIAMVWSLFNIQWLSQHEIVVPFTRKVVLYNHGETVYTTTIRALAIYQMAISALVFAVHCYFGHWLTLNFFSMSCVFVSLLILKLKSVKSVIAVSVTIILFDVLAVFFSDIMETVARESMDGGSSLFVASNHFAFPTVDGGKSIIGGGDFLFPILIISFFRKVDLSREKYTYAPMSFFGVILGLVVCLFTESERGLPALLFLLPLGVLFPIVAAVFEKKLFELVRFSV